MITDLLAKLPKRIAVKIQVNEQTGCWEWTGSIAKGYGQVMWGGRAQLVHRVVYRILIGDIPDELEIDHVLVNEEPPRCVKHCANPDHLEPVTHRTNILRSSIGIASINAAKTHCPQGHEYDKRNTYIDYKGGRRCKACMRNYRQMHKDIANARRRAARRAARANGLP